ncbi:helix-turn-helix domain-containing protein (plasmid) [Roseomonas marmotae]|uniref:helix-turn-helix domain-containing protein n=1 Tax=Roseomonas marmotae TaxID=2768161 RepID=UPI001AD7D01D|nr:helix-turn-helix domain-containing protein [Roseomonas marmotae]QTI82098.1 helix-turn-helix domain-containing protein [Roseomonas marmotae]
MLEDAPVKRLSAVIGRLRSDLGVTQAEVAKAAGLDQSRVSRIEKGDISNAVDTDRVLDALQKLGSTDVAAYRDFASREWLHIEPPTFWNPQRVVLEETEDMLCAVEDFLSDEDRPWPLRRAIEGHKATLLRGAAYLLKLKHNLAFIGDIGVGKSTALAFAFDLLVPTSPSTKAMDRTVLETGAGGTTICEVHIRRGPEFGLSVLPLSDAELRSLVADFCAAKQIALKSDDRALREAAAVSRETERAIRNMAGLTRKTIREDGKITYQDPVQDLVEACATEDELRTRVLELMRLGERTRRDLWYESSSLLQPMEWLAKTFREVNNGRLPDVSLPKSIDLVIPAFGKDFGELDITVIDTKGVDDVAVREDLDLRLRDPRTAVVFCSKFNDAPGVSSKTLLQHMRQTFSEPLSAGKVAVMALPRPDEALAMKDDMGETAMSDEEGYAFKEMQVQSDLQASDLPEIPVLFFNAQSDPAESIRKSLLGQLNQMREAAAERLSDLCAAVNEILENHEAQTMIFAVEEVAKRMRDFLGAHSKLGARERLAYRDVLTTVQGVRHASTLWAATRRSGTYTGLNIMHQVGMGAARDAVLRSNRWFASLEDTLAALKQDKDLVIATRTIDQIGQRAATSRKAFLEAVQRAGTEVYHGPLKDSDVWQKCAEQWGMGPGFKGRVAGELEKWFESRADLKEQLEEMVNSLWERTVLAPLMRLADETTPEPEVAMLENVVEFRRTA